MFEFNKNLGSEYSYNASTMGVVALVVLVFLSARFLLTLAGLAYVPALSIAVTVLVVTTGLTFRSKMRRRTQEKTIALQTQLSDLKDQEFALRYQEAKLAGKLDRWAVKDASEAEQEK